jgi:iron complex outermembrane receptor protein
MAHTTHHAPAWRRYTLSLAALLSSCAPLAAAAQGEAETQQVTIRAAKPAASVTGFGQTPLASVPMQASVITTEQMRDLGVRRLSDIARIDAAVGDGYNAEGYYDFLSVRGFVLDPRFNYRRDGLPISAETTIALDNK